MAKQNIKPLFDNVLVKPLEAQERLPSGIILPDSAKEKPQMGEVMAVGPGTVDEKGKDVKMVVRVGNEIRSKGQENCDSNHGYGRCHISCTNN